MITITIPGTPVAQGRARFTRTGIAYDPAKSKDYKGYIKLIALEYKPDKPLEGPLRVEIDIYKDIPKSFSKKKREQAIAGAIRPITKPDVSNYCKGIEDGMNGVIWKDDSQITELLVRKAYGEKPMAIISVEEL